MTATATTNIPNGPQEFLAEIDALIEVPTENQATLVSDSTVESEIIC